MALEINTYFGRCRCCLTYGYSKNMWEEYYTDGKKEIYIDMLVEVFALSWEPTKEITKLDQICETCIMKLRDAHNFKKTILESQLHLFGTTDEDPENEVKLEQIDVDDDKSKETTDFSLYVDELDVSQCEESEDMKEYEEVEYSKEEFIKETVTPNPENEVKLEQIDVDDDKSKETTDFSLYVDELDVSQCEESEDMKEYEEVEYLEEEFIKETVTPTQTPRIKRRKNNIDCNSNMTWDKRLPKSEQCKTYRQYTNQDLRACLKALRSENLTPREASERFNIPRRTIAAKMKMDPEDLENELENERHVREEKRRQLIKELKSILTYTNAMLYKSHTNGYSCAYCIRGQYYDNPDELRTHNKMNHEEDKIGKIDFAMRPYWMHEIVKLDIHNLECIKCCIQIIDWNDMFQHVKDKHNVVLDQAYTRAIPYDLTEQLKCTLCKKEFTFYNQLDAHMNAHYHNYVCFDCGDTFVSELRLKRHVKTHEGGKYACRVCHQGFPSFKKKIDHEGLFHKLRSKFKCQHCNEMFSKEYLRHVHLLNKHKEYVVIIPCEVCGKSFTWRPSYDKHLKKHKNFKILECDMCDMKCFSKIEFKDHLLKHSGEKRYNCYICDQNYITMNSLKRHIRRRHRDGRI